MNMTELTLETIPDYTSWLEEQIRQLSIQALQTNAVTCNACGETIGTYIVEYAGQTFRLSGERTYAFLNFIVADHV
jgi:hypothetical protein